MHRKATEQSNVNGEQAHRGQAALNYGTIESLEAFMKTWQLIEGQGYRLLDEPVIASPIAPVVQPPYVAEEEEEEIRPSFEPRKEITMFKAFKVTLGIVLGLLFIPAVLAVITAVTILNK